MSADEGGDPACWLDSVCPDCGAFIEGDAGMHICRTPRHQPREDGRDLEPIPLSDGPPLAPTEPGEPAEPTAAAPRPPAVRDRFLVALAVVVAIAVIALAVQLRSIARDTAHDAECSEALVAIVSSPTRGSADVQRQVQEQLQACLGPDVTLPGGGSQS